MDRQVFYTKKRKKEKKKKKKETSSLLHKIWIITSREQNEIRAKNVAISLKFAKYPNIAFVLRLPKSVNTLRSFSNPSPCVHNTSFAVIFHGFLLSRPGFREMFISIVEMYPHFRFRRDISAIWRKAEFMNRSARIRRKYGVESGRYAMPNYEEKAVEKLGKTWNEIFLSFFLSLFFF